MTLCDKPELTAAQAADLGKAARRLLAFAWASVPREIGLIACSLEAVCKTYGSDPAESAAILRRALEPEHLARHGYEELHWLAREIKRIIPIDPGFVEDVYRAAFSHQETSQETTAMGNSRILAMTSNRRQDYGGGLYALSEAYPEFLARAPENATRALIALTEEYVRQRHTHGEEREEIEAFELGGVQAQVRTDGSSIWDEGDTYEHDDPVKILNAFQTRIEALADEEGSEELRRIIGIVSENAVSAVLWGRLISAGTRKPSTLGKELLPLAWTPAILAGSDTSVGIGEFIRALFPTMNPTERERVEKAVLALPDRYPEEKREAAARLRDRLLGCMDEASLVTEEARSLLQERKRQGPLPRNVPSVVFSGWSSQPYTEEAYLKDEGVSVEAEPNARVRRLAVPAKEFAEKHLNSTPTPEEAQAIFSGLRELRDALAAAKEEGVHPIQERQAWGHLAEACEAVAKQDDLDCAGELGAFVRETLLQAGMHPYPPPRPEYDAQFDDHPSWGKPSPRISAAAGLILLARHESCCSAAVPEALERLSTDEVPAVRYQIARHLCLIGKTAPDLMWRLAAAFIERDPSPGVLHGLLVGSLQRLSGLSTDRVASLTKALYDRRLAGSGSERLQADAVGLLTQLCIWRDHPLAAECVRAWAADPSGQIKECGAIASHFRRPITHGPVEPPDAAAESVRKRTLGLALNLVQNAKGHLRRQEERNAGKQFADWPVEDQEAARGLARLLDGIGTNLYFASGAHDSKRGRGNPEDDVTSEQQKRFYSEAGPLLDELLDLGYADLTHYLLETLEVYIPLDPQGVFLRIRRAIQSGQKGGYQFESLAVGLVVRLVERYLAEYRLIFRDDENCRRALTEILDVFVQAGWPAARHLTYRLDEIYR